MPFSNTISIKRNLLIVLLAIVAITATRLWSHILWPQLAFEDSTHMISFFFNTNDPIFILRKFNGYMSLLPSIMGWLTIQLPLYWTPYAMTWLAISVVCLAKFSFALPQFRFLIQQDTYRFLTVIFISLYPISKGAIEANLTNSQWSFLFLFILILLARPPQKTATLLLFTIFASCVALSHPLCAATAPLIFILLYTKNSIRERTVLITLFLLLVFYVKSSSATVDFRHYLLAIPEGVKMYIHRVGAELFIGTEARYFLFTNNYTFVIYSLGVIIPFMPLAIAFKRKLPVNILLIIIGLLGTSLAFVIVSKTRVEYNDAISIIYYQRFFYVPKALLLLAWSIAIFHNRPAPSYRFLIVCVFGLIFFFVPINYYNNHLYNNSVDLNKIKLQTLYEAENNLRKAKNGKLYQAFHSNEATENWPLHLDIDCYLHRKKNCFDIEQERLQPIGNVEMPRFYSVN